MNRFVSTVVAATICTAASGMAYGDTIKVGVIAPFSGPFAVYG